MTQTSCNTAPKTTKTRSRAIIPLTLGIVTVICSSCFNWFFRPSEPIEIDYNHVLVVGVENSYYATQATVDTMHAEAVMMRLTLSDTTNSPYRLKQIDESAETPSVPRIKTTLAPKYYIPRNKVTTISVKTLFDINDRLQAGDDIMAQLLFSDGSAELYATSEKAIAYLNSKQWYGDHYILLILTSTVENTEAQFEVSVTLDNGATLVGTSPQFVIIE